MIKWLNGNKTYLGFVGLGMIGILVSLGWIDKQVAGAIASGLTAWTGVAIRHAYRKGQQTS